MIIVVGNRQNEYNPIKASFLILKDKIHLSSLAKSHNSQTLGMNVVGNRKNEYNLLKASILS